MDRRDSGDRAPEDRTAEGQTWTITDLAREFDLTTRAIRFYEDQKLIAPARRGQARIYGPRDRTRLKLILRGKRLGFSLGEVAEIIDLYEAEPGEVGQLAFFLGKIAERRRQLEQQREDIEVTLAELEAVEANCHRRLGVLRGGTR
jgi:DNA-binding transcriptional MerR regulator